MSLSPNAIPTLHNTLNLPNYQPVVQILDIKLLNSKRYQLVISDGKFYQQALLSPNCNDVIGLEGIGIFHMIKILEYVCNLVKETKILFITELEALSAYDCQIGNPSRYNDIKNSQENPTQEQTPHKLIPEKLIPKSTDLLYVPIRALNPNSSNWVIKARISQKSGIKTWTNLRGEGKLFSLTLIDSFSDEIQATFFNSAVDLFYETFKDGAVYTFSNGEIKSAKRKYNSTENEYQISFDSNSIISEVSDDGSIGFLKFNFVPIDQLPKIDIGTIVDVCGRITEISPVSNIFSRKGENLHKRTVKITDHTLHSIEITLWNDLANLPELENLNLESLPILAAKSLKLTNFNIMSLTCDKSVSSIHINPKNFQELEFFEKWNNTHKMKSIQLTPLTNQTTSRLQNELRTIREIKEMSEHMMSANQPKFHTVIGYISRLRSEDFKSMTYPACNNHNCKKKMTIEIDGFYKCPVCKISFPSCTYRYLLSFDFNDNTGTSTVNGFDEIGLGLFGMTANNLEEISKDQEKFDIVLSQIIKKEFLGTLKVNLDSNNQSVRYTMVKLGQMNYSTGAKLFWDEINYIMGQLC